VATTDIPVVVLAGLIGILICLLVPVVILISWDIVAVISLADGD